MNPAAKPACRRGTTPEFVYAHLKKVCGLYLLVGTAAVNELLLIRHTYAAQCSKFAFSVHNPGMKHYWLMCVRLCRSTSLGQVCVTVLSRPAELLFLTSSPRPRPLEIDEVLDMRDIPSKKGLHSFPTEDDRGDRPVLTVCWQAIEGLRLRA
jgi:hypothetical protein